MRKRCGAGSGSSATGTPCSWANGAEMSLGGRKLHSVAVHVDPAQFLAGWRSDAGTLFLVALLEGRVGELVAARIGLVGQTIRATVFGSISLVRRVGRPSLPPGIELQLDR